MKAEVTGVTAWQGTPTGGTLSIRAPRYVDSSGNASPEEYSAVLDVTHNPPRWMDALDPTRKLYVIVQGPDDPVGVRARFYEVLHYGPTKSVRTEFTRKLISSDLNGLIFDYAMPEPTDIPVGFGDAPLTMRAAQQVIEEGGAVVSEWSDIKVDIAQSAAQATAAAGLIPTTATSTTLPSGAGDYRIMSGAEAGQVWTRTTNGADPERNEPLEAVSTRTGVLRAASVAALATIVTAASVTVSGYYGSFSGGGGQFEWQAGARPAANGYTVIHHPTDTSGWWQRVNPTGDVREAGARLDGVTDDTDAIQVVLDNHPRPVIPTGVAAVSKRFNHATRSAALAIRVNDTYLHAYGRILNTTPNDCDTLAVGLQANAGVRLSNIRIRGVFDSTDREGLTRNYCAITNNQPVDGFDVEIVGYGGGWGIVTNKIGCTGIRWNNNRLYGYRGTGLWVGYGATDVQVNRNWIDGLDLHQRGDVDDGVLVAAHGGGIHQNVQACNNVCVRRTTKGIGYGSVWNGVFTGNLSLNCVVGVYGLCANDGDGINMPSYNCVVDHNVISGTLNNPATSSVGIFIKGNIGGSVSHNIVRVQDSGVVFKAWLIVQPDIGGMVRDVQVVGNVLTWENATDLPLTPGFDSFPSNGVVNLGGAGVIFTGNLLRIRVPIPVTLAAVWRSALECSGATSLIGTGNILDAGYMCLNEVLWFGNSVGSVRLTGNVFSKALSRGLLITGSVTGCEFSGNEMLQLGHPSYVYGANGIRVFSVETTNASLINGLRVRDNTVTDLRNVVIPAGFYQRTFVHRAQVLRNPQNVIVDESGDVFFAAADVNVVTRDRDGTLFYNSGTNLPNYGVFKRGKQLNNAGAGTTGEYARLVTTAGALYREVWSGAGTYVAWDWVLGSNGRVYMAVQDGGQATDPTTDTAQAYWVQMATSAATLTPLVIPAAPAIARVYRSTAQSIPAGVFTTLMFDSEAQDTAGLHDTATNTSRLTVVTAGNYNVSGHLIFNSNSTGIRAIRIMRNGVSEAEQWIAALSGFGTPLSVSTNLVMSTGDYVEIQVRQESGGALSTSSGSVAACGATLTRLP